MPITLTEARFALRERLDEPNARAWSDTELERWLNEGAKDIARKTECLQAEASLSFAAGVNQATLPTNCIRVHRAEWLGSGRQLPLTYQDFNSSVAVSWVDNTTNQGTPHLFTMWGVGGGIKVILYPTPAVAGTLKVWYYKLPTAPTTELGVYDLPEGWEDAMYEHATAAALRRDRDPRWQEAKAQYDEVLGALFDVTRRYSDQSGQIVGDYPAVNAWLYEFGG